MRSMLLIAVLVAFARMVSAQMIMPLLNAGFETDGGSGEWLSNPGDWWTYGNAANRETWAAQPDIGGSYGCAFFGWMDGEYGEIGQNVSVEPSDFDIFTFSVNLECESNFTSANSELWMKMEFWDASEKVYETDKHNIYYAAKAAGTGVWGTYTMTYTNYNSSVVMVKPVIGFENASDQGGGEQAVKFDNATLTYGNLGIPEPTSAALLGLGIGFIYLLRRKVQK